MLLAGVVGKITNKQKKYIYEIYLGNQRMIDLVNMLLNVSRIELGTFITESSSTNIVKLVESFIHEYKILISEKNIVFSFFAEDEIPYVEVDPKNIGIVIQNLLSNAIKYTPNGGKVEISILYEEVDVILIKISDTGFGIPKSQQSMIFTKLFRASNVIDKGTDGNGLGLYIAKSIIDKTGGKIWFRSHENTGTTFFVNLPLKNNNKNIYV